MPKRTSPGKTPAARAAKPGLSYPPDDGPLTLDQTKQIQAEADRLSTRPMGPPRRIKSLF